MRRGKVELRRRKPKIGQMMGVPMKRWSPVLMSLFVSLFLSSFSFAAEVQSAYGNRYISGFPEAKRVLPKIYSGHQTTLYCGCKYYGKEVNMNSCNAYSEGQSSRFKKLEWEHVVPAEKLGRVTASWSQGDLVCKKKKGRKCAEKASPLFRQMEGDLYNLWPESGGINGARSDKPPRDSVEGKLQAFGKCETVVGKNAFAPRKEVHGEIARTYLYMKDVYGIPLTEEEVNQFKRWDQEDPVDAWECERARRIKDLQGNVNRFVEEPCQKAGL